MYTRKTFCEFKQRSLHPTLQLSQHYQLSISRHNPYYINYLDILSQTHIHVIIISITAPQPLHRLSIELFSHF